MKKQPNFSGVTKVKGSYKSAEMSKNNIAVTREMPSKQTDIMTNHLKLVASC